MEHRDRLKKLVNKMLDWIKSDDCSLGERAALRRMDSQRTGRVLPGAFWKLLVSQEICPESESETRAWEAILQGMALSADVSSGEAPSFAWALGTADAASAGTASEDRLIRMLQAQGERFYDLLRGMVRFCASRGISFNWVDLARLCLAQNSEQRRKTCEHLAQDYYLARFRAQAVAEKQQSQTNHEEENIDE